jgi:hypothetical protein
MKKCIVSVAALLVPLTVSPTVQADVLPEVSSHYAVDTDPHKRPPLLPAGTRLQTVGVSEFNELGNSLQDFMFPHPDGSATLVRSPEPGRALITGVAESPFFARGNAVKMPPLWRAVAPPPISPPTLRRHSPPWWRTLPNALRLFLPLREVATRRLC